MKIGSSYPGSENLSGTLKNSNESLFIRLGATFINFSKFFPRLRLFQGLRLLILNKIPKATFIKEATTIRNSRVLGVDQDIGTWGGTILPKETSLARMIIHTKCLFIGGLRNGDSSQLRLDPLQPR